MVARNGGTGWLAATCKIATSSMILLSVMLFCSYSNTFTSPPVLDDFHTFIEEPLVRIQEWDFSSLIALSQTKFKWNRLLPITTLSFDLWTGRGDLFHFHLSNLIIHFFVFISVFFLIDRLCRADRINAPNTNQSLSVSIPVFVAGIWALHPLQTNAVTYIVQRMASMAALFTILSVAFYVSGRLATRDKGGLNRRAVVYYLSSLVSMVLGLLSKENSGMIPLLLFFTEAWFFRTDLFHHLVVTARKRWVLGGVATIMVFTAIAHYIFTNLFPGFEHRHFTLLQRLMTESRIVLWYISLLIWPVPRRLSLEHDVVVSTSLLSPLTTLPAIIFLVFTGYWAVARRRRYPLITFGIAWFGLNLVIESSIIPLELVFEHRMYLPSVGLILSMGVAFYTFVVPRLAVVYAENLAKLSWCLFFVLCSMLSLLTFHRNSAWHDMETLAKDNVSKAPNHPRSHANLSTVYLRRAKFQEAIEEARIAISLGKPHFEQYIIATNNIIAAHTSLGAYEDAVEEGKRLLRDKPPGRIDISGLPGVHLNLALAQKNLDDLKGAFLSTLNAFWSLQNMPGRSSDLKQVGLVTLNILLDEAKERNLDLDSDGKADPGDWTYKFWMAQHILNTGDRQTAQDLLSRAVSENENDHDSAQLLARLNMEDRLNRIQEEKKDFTEKYVLHPYSPFNVCMAGAFLAQKHPVHNILPAIGNSLLELALYLKPDSADAHLLKAWYHYSKGESSEAINEAKRSLELDPEYSKAWLGLGFFLVKANRPQEAIMAFEKTLELYPHYPQRLAILDIAGKLRSTLHSLAKEDTAQTN